MDAPLAEIAKSLAMDDIPVKLRCAACNRLATNAFRQSSLPQACPICLHEPVKAEDCRPNKTLRMTIKAFLRKLATEQEKARKKQSVETAAVTPDTTSAPATGEHAVSRDSGSTSAQVAPTDDNVDSTKTGTSSSENQSVPTEAQKDVPQPSIEVAQLMQTRSTGTNFLQATEDRVREESYQEQAQGESENQNHPELQQDGSKQPQNQQSMQMQGMNGQWPAGNGMTSGINGFGVSGVNGGFPNMAMGNFGDYNSMMQFMPNNNMSAFPNVMGMPGMPGMGMDPMQAMSQGMFGGFGGPGMGMSGMNAAGMGFSTGQGWNDGGYNGQPAASWMSGQDKYNQNAYGGHAHGMGGDFGANAGYNMPSHQANYNQMNHQQSYHSNHDFQNGYHGQGFHSRGRGRGRGFPYAPRGRGGYNHQVMPGNHTNNDSFHHQVPPYIENPFPPPSQQSFQSDSQATDGRGAHHSANGASNEQATDEQIAREMAPGDADESPYEPPNAVPADTYDVTVEAKELSNPPDDAAPTGTTDQTGAKDEHQQKEQQEEEHAEKPAPIKSFISDEQPQDAEPDPSTSATTLNTMMPPPSPVVSLPSQQFPVVESPQEYSMPGRGRDRRLSRGSSDFRGAGRGRAPVPSLTNGTSYPSVPHSQSAQIPMAPPTEPKGLGVEGAPKGPKAMREGLPTASIRGGRGFSIVGRASVASHNRTNGQVRSQSASESSDHERRRERHRRRSRKYNEEEAETEDPRDSHRSSHRSSRRTRDDPRDEPREDNDSREHGHRSSRHRSHCDDNNKNRDNDSHHRSSRKRSRTPTSAANDEEAPHHNHHHSSSSSRKRRSRHEADSSFHRERKRSRRDHETSSSTQPQHPQPLQNPLSRRPSTSASSTLPANVPLAPKSHQTQTPTPQAAKTQPKETKPPTATTDPHELERQARNKERMLKEMQRREAMDGRGGGEGGKKGRGGGGGRRMNYKFEDELDGLAEGGRERWG
ncbi:MAG: hypothetical protein Q9220_005937 [cf. Caloplaca sp. 1 TL-2023]